MADIEATIKEVIVEQLGVSADKVTLEARFVDDLGGDSLDLVQLIMTLEDKFGIDIPDDEAEKMLSVGDAVKYIEEHLPKE